MFSYVSEYLTYRILSQRRDGQASHYQRRTKFNIPDRRKINKHVPAFTAYVDDGSMIYALYAGISLLTAILHAKCSNLNDDEVQRIIHSDTFFFHTK